MNVFNHGTGWPTCLIRNSLWFFFVVSTLSGSLQADTKMLQSDKSTGTFLELYTSQGCSSCPPAERWVNAFVDAPGLWEDLIPISFHVDYWDYIGWKDPFARKAFSGRQRQYHRIGHTKNVATPGFVVNGRGWNGWFVGHDLPAPVTKFSGALIVSLLPDSGKVEYDSTLNLNRLNVHAALLGFGIKQSVTGGENAGRVLPQDFVVVGYERAKMNAHQSTSGSKWLASVSLPKPVVSDLEREAWVFWITQGDDPAPLQVVADWR